MAKSAKYLGVNPKKLERSELESAVEALAKTANQRLRTLEQTGNIAKKSSAYSYIERLAFDKKNIKKGEEQKREFISQTKQGNLAFSRKIKSLSEEALRNELKSLQQFLGAKTSTVSGTKKTLASSYKKFKEQFYEGKPLEEAQYRGFWEDSLIKHAIDLFYTEINRMFSLTSEYNIKPDEFKAIISSLGITESTTKGEVDRRGIEFRDLERSIIAWSDSGLNATEGEEISLPEDL